MIAGREEADRLAADHAAGREPDLGTRDAKAYAIGLDALIQTRRIEAARWAARRLCERPQVAALITSLDLLLQATPPATGDGGYDSFQDDPDADVQTVRRQGARSVLFVFTGISGRAGMPLPLAHRWFGALDAHVVYLRDVRHQAYNLGMASLGADYGATLDALWTLAARLRADRIVTFGNSVGGYGALRFGLDLRAEAVLAFSPLTSMAPPLTSPAELARRGLRAGLDLRPFFLASPAPPRTLIAYIDGFEPDRRQALHLEGAPGVRLEPLSGSDRHDSVLRSVEQGSFTRRLQVLRQA